MSRSFALRLLETFFRRWLLCLLPLVLLMALGVASVASTKGKYVAASIMYVESETLLTKLTGAGATTTNGYQTPAQSANDRLRSLLGTDGFVRTVAEKANLAGAVDSGLITLGQIRSSIGTAPSSANTLRIGVANTDPTVAFNLATAVVPAFVDWVVQTSLSDSEVAEEFLTTLANSYKTALNTAQNALNSYLGTHPDPVIGIRPTAELNEIARLTGTMTDAQSRYTETLGKAENARLASAQTRSDVSGRLRLVDAPKYPTVTDASLKGKVVQFALFLVLGTMLSAAVVFLNTLADKSIRLADEVRENLGVPLLAVIPESSTSRLRPWKATANA